MNMQSKRLVAALWFVAMLAGCGDSPTTPPVPDAGPPIVFLCAADAQCADGVYCNGEERCAPNDADADERGCAPAAAGPCGDSQTCNEAELRCVNDCAVETDADGDGVMATACGGLDCDDADANRFPGNVEVCDADGHDEDCDDTTFGERDLDGDGFTDALCCNGDTCGDDCDDTNASLRPNGAEACDGLDNDCDGLTDEGVDQVFFPDLDGDGYGDASSSGSTMRACELPSGFSLNALDCNDAAASINPAAFDRCDGTDNDDCSGVVDDPVGGCTCDAGESRRCPLEGVCGTGTQDCVAGLWGACTVSPTPETCNGLDDDCNGVPDEGCACSPGSTIACGTDEGTCSAGVRVCSAAGVFSACVAAVGPSVERCNGLDDDCDGNTDEDAATTTWFEDVDGDGVGVAGPSSVRSCDAPSGFVPVAGDCFPEDASYVCEDNLQRIGFLGRARDAAVFDATGDRQLWVVGDDASDSQWATIFRQVGDVWSADTPAFDTFAAGDFNTIDITGDAIVIAGFQVHYFPLSGDTVGAQTIASGRPSVRAIAVDMEPDGDTDVMVWGPGQAMEGQRYDGFTFVPFIFSEFPDWAGRSFAGPAGSVYTLQFGILARHHWNGSTGYTQGQNGGTSVPSVQDCRTATLDGDGEEDLICWSGPQLHLVRLDPTLSNPLVVSVDTLMYNDITTLEVVDFDGDGVSDIFAVADGNVEYWRGSGGGFPTREVLRSGLQPDTLKVLDIDGDGDLDLLLAGFRRVQWLENRAGRFIPAGEVQ